MNNLTPNLNQAKAFLMMLNPNAKDFHFRVFIDDKKMTRYSSNFKGSLVSQSEKFQLLNNRSRGIFVVINEGGQKDAEITKIRAVFADTDGAPLDPIIKSLEPHMVIKTSPGRWHVYWLVNNEFPLDQFKPIQAAIAHKYGTDKSVTNPSRVMRLPGFFHRKEQPFLCRFRNCNMNLTHYSKDQIINGLQLELTPRSEQYNYYPNNLLSADKTKARTDLESILPYLGRLDYLEWIKVGFVIAEELGEDGRDLFIRWSRGDLERSNQQ
jgi:hypothetical protein